MSQEIYQDDITFIRPLLNISKASIREFAAYNNIPHLPNSTPLWSQRGQIRANIVPVLDAWDTRMIPGLFNISSIMQQMHGYFTMYVRNIVHEIKKNGHIHIQIHDIQLSPIFWKEIIKLTQSIIPSEKAVKNIINRLASLKSTFDRIKIHQTSYIEVHKSVRISLQKNDKDSILLGIHNKS
jgi:tRNA(Ile)-lysidine synthase TilS/MesJ